MTITLKRIYMRDTYTLGALQIQTESNNDFRTNKYFCDTLEPHAIDWRKEEKIEGKTAIPFGTYEIEMGMSRKYRMTMPYLKNVPFFKGVMIHSGNFPKDTQGCILVGVNPPTRNGGVVGKVVNSRMWMQMVRDRIRKARAAGERVTVMVTRGG